MRVRVRAEDQGRVITCEADNGLGVIVASNITLDVLRKYYQPCLSHSLACWQASILLFCIV